MGSCAYPTIAEGAFAMTNTILRTVGKKTGNKAMVVPPHMNEEEGCMEMVYRWKPDPKSAAEFELVVCAYSNNSRQLARRPNFCLFPAAGTIRAHGALYH